MEIIFDSTKSWDNWDEIQESLDCIDGSVTITGTLGLWNGTHEIIPVECESLSEAITKCIGRDTENLVIKEDENKYYVSCSHYDGTNRFTITFTENDV